MRRAPRVGSGRRSPAGSASRRRRRRRRETRRARPRRIPRRRADTGPRLWPRARDSPGALWKARRGAQPPAREPELEPGAETAEPVAHAVAQIDRRRLLEVGSRTGDLGDLVAAPQDLGQDLVVEHEVVGVRVEWQLAQETRLERAV